MSDLAATFALIGLTLGALGLALRGVRTSRRALPVDRASMKGSPSAGVRYAFTLGMAPWAKESTRLHALAYLRGIGFHLGIFLAMAVLLVRALGIALPDPVLLVTAAALMLAAILGILGAAARLVERNLRHLSTPDDHFAVWWVSLFILLTGLSLLFDVLQGPAYVVAGLMFAYVPLGKIRHCLYFFYSRLFFGRFVGRRGVLPHPLPAPTGGSR